MPCPNSVNGSFGTTKCWRYIVLSTQNSKTEDLLWCSMAMNPAYSSAIISLVWGLSLFKISFSITDEADNNSYMYKGCLVLELSIWCKIQSLIFNKGVVVKQ